MGKRIPFNEIAADIELQPKITTLSRTCTKLTVSGRQSLGSYLLNF